MNQFFAQNPSDLKSVAETLSERIKAHPDLQWALLIDTAFDHGGQTPHREALINGYSGHETLNELEELAPCLYRIVPDGDSAWQQFLALLAHCNGRPMWSLIGTAGSIATLPDRWQPYWQADVGDRQSMLLRFADTRVLSTLPTLLADQWSALAAPAAVWLYPDRQGSLVELPMTPGKKPPEQIRLSLEQLGQFMRAAEPDRHLDFLWQHTPETFDAGLPPQAYHDWAEAACQLADAQGIDSPADQQTLSMLAIVHRGAIDRDQGLMTLLELREWSPGKLAAAIRRAAEPQS